MKRLFTISAAWMILACVAATAFAQEEAVTKDNVIAGEMNVDFKTRTNLDATGALVAGSPALGAKDEYNFKLKVADTTEWAGLITRQPNLYSKIIKANKQPAQLEFNVNIWVLNTKNPDQRKNVGKWVGTAPIDTQTGAYLLAGGSGGSSPMRIAITDPTLNFTDKFGGKLVGKAEKKEGLTAYTYKRLVGNKTVTFVVKKSDPMRFAGLELAKGPTGNYARTTVDGRLDYDYETGNWLTEGFTFKYNVGGKEMQDKVTGTIKWIEDENRKSNGKGYYDFNLRFNEPTTTEASVFAGLSDEEAFFKVDNSVPCLTGKVSYEDKFIAGGDENAEPVPEKSKVTFALNANKLNKTQIVNFFKLWMVCIGPTNDE